MSTSPSSSASTTYLLPTLLSPLESPGSTTSSSLVSGAPLTPMDELDKAAGEMVISHDDDEETDDERETASFAAALNKPLHISLDPLTSPFAGFSFGSVDISSRPDMVSPNDVTLPTEGFTFGTCSFQPFLGTPTAESGPFEYPESAGPSRKTSISSPKKAPLALGETHRRGSIVAHPAHVTLPSPPSTRRSSTCSTIVTLPIAGRRPSILHSATAENAVPAPLTSIPSTPGPSSRRSSIMFQQKSLPAPIPPSLLARRGSVPAAQLFGLPISEQLKQPRGSYSAGSHTTTTAALYRRQSMASESGVSSGSGRTVTEGDDYGRRMSTRSVHVSMMSTGAVDHISYRPDRRPSLPFTQHFNTSPARGNLSRQSISGGVPSRTNFSRSSNSFASPTSPCGTRHNSLASNNSTSTSSSTSSIPSSPISRFPERRARQSSSLHSSLSSSEESNEDEGEDEELPTPCGSAFSVGRSEGNLPIAPTFSDPWASDPLAVEETSVSESMLTTQKTQVPLETPPLETVAERPLLESTDSSRTERG